MASMGLGSSGKATCKKDSYVLVVCWCSDERGWARNVPWSRPGRDVGDVYLGDSPVLSTGAGVVCVSRGC